MFRRIHRIFSSFSRQGRRAAKALLIANRSDAKWMAHHQARENRVGYEALEPRQLLATIASIGGGGLEILIRETISGSPQDYTITEGDSGAVVITLGAAADTFAATEVAGATVDGTMKILTIPDSAITSFISIEGQGGNDVFNVHSLPVFTSGGELFLGGGVSTTDDDTFNIGGGTGTTHLGSIDSPVRIDADAGIDLVVVDDSNHDIGETYTITDTTVTRSGTGSNSFAGLTISTPGDLTNLVLKTSSFGGVTNIVNVSPSPTPPFEIDIFGGLGNETVNLVPGAGAITIDGGSGSDKVFLDDSDHSGSVDIYTITEDTVDRTGFGGLSYSDVEDLELVGSDTGNTYNITNGGGTTAITSMNINAFLGADTMIATDIPMSWNLILDGGGGVDDYILDNSVVRRLGDVSNTVFAGETLSGNGTVLGAPGTTTIDGTLSPGLSPGIMNFADGMTLTDGASFDVEVDGILGPGVTMGHDQAVVTGAVTLGSVTGPTLNLLTTTGFFPAVGQPITPFTIIDNDGVDAVSGIFAGLPEGAVVPGANGYTITYTGGDGNDVVLVPPVGNNIGVAGVFVNGTDWNADFRDQVDGTADGSTFGYELTTANADVTVPWIRVNEIVITFDSPFDPGTVDMGDFALTGLTGGGTKFDPGPTPGVIPTIGTPIIEPGNMAVRLPLSGFLEPSVLTVSVNASGISDTGGIFGNDYDQTFLALPGDVQGTEYIVLGNDRNLINLGLFSVIGNPNYNFRADLDGNAILLGFDRTQVNVRLFDFLTVPDRPFGQTGPNTDSRPLSLVDRGGDQNGPSSRSATGNPVKTAYTAKPELALVGSKSVLDSRLHEVDREFGIVDGAIDELFSGDDAFSDVNLDDLEILTDF